MKDFAELLKRKAKEGYMSDNESKARSTVLNELKTMMHGELGKDLPEVARMRADSQSGGLGASQAKKPGHKVGAGMYDSNDQHSEPTHMGVKVEADSAEHLMAALEKAKQMAAHIPVLEEHLKRLNTEGAEAQHNLEPDVNNEFDEGMMEDSDNLEKYSEEEANEPADEEKDEPDSSLEGEAKEPQHKDSLKKYRK